MIILEPLLIVTLFQIAANAGEDFEVMYSKQTSISSSNVIWVDKQAQSKSYFSEIAQDKCAKGFCLIWFFNNKDQAMVGVDRLKDFTSYVMT